MNMVDNRNLLLSRNHKPQWHHKPHSGPNRSSGLNRSSWRSWSSKWPTKSSPRPKFLLPQFRSLQMPPASAEGPGVEAMAMVVKSRSVMVHLLRAHWGTLSTVGRRADIFTERKDVVMGQLAPIVTSAGLLKELRAIHCSANRRASTTSGLKDVGTERLAAVAISALGHGRQMESHNQMDPSQLAQAEGGRCNVAIRWI